MSYSSPLGSTISKTHVRTPNHLSPFSGMCSVCTLECVGPCEIGLSAIRGSEAIYPFATDINQFASEKDYPLDFSHFNINGRVFGAWGCNETVEQATYSKVNLRSAFGKKHPVPLKAPIILPAMAKLNWKDYYAGAALAGVVVVIGEDVVMKDKNLELKRGKVHSSPLLKEMVDSFRAYDQGYGDIVVQANMDDEHLGVLEYAIEKLHVTSVEIKFGQAAKGIQGLGRIKSIDEALRLKELGYLVHPDPSDPDIAASYEKGIGQTFEKVGKLPLWDETSLVRRVEVLRQLGAKRVCFKTGPFDGKDLMDLLMIASAAETDLVTFDGAGGGTGNSPVKMMNEWGIPTVNLESMVYRMLHKMKEKGYALPPVAITGGFSMEDHVFKGLALGAPYVTLVGIGRAAMAAAMVAKQVGDEIAAGAIPKEYQRFGTTLEEVFENVKRLKVVYGNEALNISPGAIGLYSYLERISAGLQQLMALNRRFSLEYISRDDLIPLTALASSTTGIKSCAERLTEVLDKW